MSPDELIQKYKAYQEWLKAKPEWGHAELLEIIKHTMHGSIYYDKDMNLVVRNYGVVGFE